VTGCLSMFYTVEVSFDEIKDPNEQAFFQNLPTSFSLPPKTIAALTYRGADLLRTSPEYNRLLCDIGRSNINVRERIPVASGTRIKECSSARTS